MVIAFTDALRSQMIACLAAHQVRPHDATGLRRAAVAIVVVASDAERDGTDPYDVTADELSVIPGDISGVDGQMNGVAGGAAFLLCRRAAGMSKHAGPWALPGGRMDAGETAEETALRELAEELGLSLPESAVLGRLDDYPTRSGYVITPVVMWGGGDVVLTPAPGEVAHAYRIGLHELQRPDSPRFVTIPESDRPVVQVPLGGDLIHAPTGAVLLQFRWVALDGRTNARVDMYEQPVFAWR